MLMRKQQYIMPWTVLIGTALALAVSIAFAGLGAVLIDNESISIEAIPYITFAAWIVATFLCTLTVGLTGEGKWLLHCCISAGLYGIILLCVGMLIFDGASSAALYGFTAMLIGFVLAIFIVAKRRSVPLKRKNFNFKFK